ncbi:MAG: elongation factor Ts [Deltaproteobacteria bacterium]|nr:elongation factor Ts [Deltaproteobacteria bacterium]MBN2674083.1 elongation factor Ts [Deltaproteobacteria bacterium]
MAKVTMDMIKELRERTAAGVVDCKKILAETDGDIEKAIEELQKRGIAKAAKKQGRIAAEGKVGMFVAEDGKTCALVEINCETDFVAKGEKFQALYDGIAKQVAQMKTNDVAAVAAANFIDDEKITVEQAITNFTAATGEKTTLRRVAFYSTETGRIGSYNHDNGRICVMVDVATSDAGLAATEDFGQMADDLAMHVAAMNPSYVRADEIPAADVAKQTEIFTAQVIEEGKPEAIAPKIVEGKIAKWKKENCLVDQIFVKDNDVTITKLLAKYGDDVSIAKFTRFEVGEGMEKRVNDLAAEVAEMTS